ncbi:hypothetical protein [Arthrobacter sp. HLT1-20]
MMRGHFGRGYLEYGLDLVASIRVPAAFCKAYGLKPTVGPLVRRLGDYTPGLAIKYGWSAGIDPTMVAESFGVQVAAYLAAEEPRGTLEGLDCLRPEYFRLAAPAGRTATGLPVGVQILGPRQEDDTVITFAELMAEVSGGCLPPPLLSWFESPPLILEGVSEHTLVDPAVVNHSGQSS